MPDTKKILFVGGYPCTGKTTLGDWLRDHRGYLHIDLESQAFKQSCLYAVWKRSLEGRDMSAFVAEAHRLHPRVVITWGFPHGWGWVPGSFRAAGAQVVWLDSDPEACRQAYLERGTGNIEALERQLSALGNHRADFVAAFGNDIISVLPHPDQRMDTLDLARAIGIPEPHP